MRGGVNTGRDVYATDHVYASGFTVSELYVMKSGAKVEQEVRHRFSIKVQQDPK
jgi:hypothetical protein